jgi:hypothetical protein
VNENKKNKFFENQSAEHADHEDPKSLPCLRKVSDPKPDVIIDHGFDKSVFNFAQLTRFPM